MKELFRLLQKELLSGRDAMLLTVLESRGSTPRGAGAVQLAGASGPLWGTIGGGAVEHTALDTARQLLSERRSLRRTFYLSGDRAEDDIGMVCGGELAIGFSFIAADNPAWRAVLAALSALAETEWGGRLVLRTDGGSPALLDKAGQLLAGEAVPNADAYAQAAFLAADGFISLPLSAGERAVVFGGGHCARALVPVLKSVGFRVTVCEERAEFARRERFPAAECVLLCDYARIDALALAPEDYAVVMTNGHSHDFTVLEQALRLPLAYVGCMGSRRKTALVNARLKEAGVPEDAIARLHAPIGMPISAETPEEIAISIAGEMIAVRAARREAAGAQKHGCPMQDG